MFPLNKVLMATTDFSKARLSSFKLQLLVQFYFLPFRETESDIKSCNFSSFPEVQQISKLLRSKVEFLRITNSLDFSFSPSS